MNIKQKIALALPKCVSVPLYAMVGSLPPLERQMAFPTWDAAVKAGGSGYQNRDLVAFRIARARLSSHVQITPAQEGFFDKVLADPAGVFADFGGSTGEICTALKRRYGAWQFTVVESPAMAKAAASLDRPIAFVDDLPKTMDVFYTSGTLQYLPNPLQVLDAVLGRTSRHAILARNCFSDQARYCLQRSWLFENGSGPVPAGYTNGVVAYPHQSLSEDAVIAVASAKGFKLTERAAEPSGVIDPATMYGFDLRFTRA